MTDLHFSLSPGRGLIITRVRRSERVLKLLVAGAPRAVGATGCWIGMIAAAPALAQSDDLPSGKNSVTVGVGVASVPRFDGATANSIEPAIGVQGSINGMSFSLQETALTIDIIRRKEASGGKLILGPLIHASLNRNSDRRTRDPQVIALGRRNIAVEVGGQIGFSKNGVFASAYDNVTFRVSYVKDVTGTHDSFMLTPAVSYGTPLSRGSYVGASLSADYVGEVAREIWTAGMSGLPD